MTPTQIEVALLNADLEAEGRIAKRRPRTLAEIAADRAKRARKWLARNIETEHLRANRRHPFGGRR